MEQYDLCIDKFTIIQLHILHEHVGRPCTIYEPVQSQVLLLIAYPIKVNYSWR